MGWTRKSARVVRDRRRPCLEILETRQLLSVSSAKPAASPVLNSDGSTNFDQIIGASVARSQFSVDGTGQTVAVIDTGVNYNNEALGAGFGPGHKVVAGVDFTGSSNGVLPTWQHGTGVAGLIASSDPNHLGIAPGADIVALRVFGDNNSGSFTQIYNALEWVVQHHATTTSRRSTCRSPTAATTRPTSSPTRESASRSPRRSPNSTSSTSRS